MISNKAVVILSLVILNANLIASTYTDSQKIDSPTTVFLTVDDTVRLVEVQGENSKLSDDTQKSSSPDKPVLRKRQNRASSAKSPTMKLQDSTNFVEGVQTPADNTRGTVQIRKQSVPQVNEEFEELFKQEKYDDVIKLGKSMGDEEFLKQICLVVKTHEQYKRFDSYLKCYNLMAKFYIGGNIEVVKVLIESEFRTKEKYVDGGYSETALPLALREDKHDRVIELFRVIQKETVEYNYKRLKIMGKTTRFEIFVSTFLGNLDLEKDGMALKRFLTHHADELGNNNSDILNTLCQELISELSTCVRDRGTEKLLVDLIGQPSLLTTVSFAKGFSRRACGVHYPFLIKHGWGDVIEEILKKDSTASNILWLVMVKECPGKFTGDFPPTLDAFDVIRKHFPTKQQKEEQWPKESAARLQMELESLNIYPIPKVLWTIIAEYIISSWLDIE